MNIYKDYDDSELSFPLLVWIQFQQRTKLHGQVCSPIGTSL